MRAQEVNRDQANWNPAGRQSHRLIVFNYAPKHSNLRFSRAFGDRSPEFMRAQWLCRMLIISTAPASPFNLDVGIEGSLLACGYKTCSRGEWCIQGEEGCIVLLFPEQTTCFSH